MKTKYFRIVLAMILCIGCAAFVLGGCSKKRSKLVVGIDTEFPPYSYKGADGSYTGFDVELAQAVGSMEKWDVELVPINWDEKDILLNEGSIDCIWSGFTINGREEDYTLTKAYCDNSIVVAVPVDSDIHNIAELEGRIVGIQAASSGSEYLTEDEEGKELAKMFKLLSQFSDFSFSFEAMAEGTLDAIIADVKVAEYFVESSGKFRLLDEALVAEQYGVALKKGNMELCDILNDDLQVLADNGTMKAIAEKYGIEDSICIGSD